MLDLETTAVTTQGIMPKTLTFISSSFSPRVIHCIHHNKRIFSKINVQMQIVI